MNTTPLAPPSIPPPHHATVYICSQTMYKILHLCACVCLCACMRALVFRLPHISSPMRVPTGVQLARVRAARMLGVTPSPPPPPPPLPSAMDIPEVTDILHGCGQPMSTPTTPCPPCDSRHSTLRFTTFAAAALFSLRILKCRGNVRVPPL